MDTPTQVLFGIMDLEVERCAKAIRNRIFSVYRDMPWTRDQRTLIEPLIREELNLLIQGVLGALDNVGCVLPDEAIGYKIVSVNDGTDIRVDDEDYVDMWLDYLNQK